MLLSGKDSLNLGCRKCQFIFFRTLRWRRKTLYSQFFCQVPFEYVHIDDAGECFLCCPASLPLSIGNLNKNSFMEVWNSKIAQSIRHSILDGSYFFCLQNNCLFFNGGGKLQKKENVTDPFYKRVISKSMTHLPVGPRELIAAYDPTCNLSCPSCRNKTIRLRGKELYDAKKIHENIFNEAMFNVERLILAGLGEPFVSKLYRSAMENFDSEKFPKMKISLVSNGIFFTPENWKRVHKCHGIIDVVSISVNAASPETYSINQRGGNFSRLLENLEFIKSLREKNIICHFAINCFVQQNNFREMKKFVNLGKKLGVDKIFFTHIVNWGTYLPDEFSKRAVHQKEHPEHNDFINVLKDPVFKEPNVFLSNLYSFLPGNLQYEDKNDSISDCSDNNHLIHDYQSLKHFLNLNDSQSEQMLELLNKLKDQFLYISSKQTINDNPPPFVYIADYLKGEQHPDLSAITKKLIDYSSQNIEKESKQQYTELYNKIQYKGKVELIEILNISQKKLFASFSVDDLIGIETGYDPFGNALDKFLK